MNDAVQRALMVAADLSTDPTARHPLVALLTLLVIGCVWYYAELWSEDEQ